MPREAKLLVRSRFEESLGSCTERVHATGKFDHLLSDSTLVRRAQVRGIVVPPSAVEAPDVFHENSGSS
jgi:hypothetical protein